MDGCDDIFMEKEEKGLVKRFSLRLKKMPSREDVSFQTAFASILTISLFMPYYVTICVIVLEGISVLFSHHRRRRAFDGPENRIMGGLMVVWAVISLCYQNFQGFSICLELLLCLSCAFYMRSFMNKWLFDSLMDTACICSIGCVIIAWIQKIFDLGLDSDNRPESVFYNANFFGMMMEFIILIALYRFFAKNRHRIFYVCTGLSALMGLYLCNSISSATTAGTCALVFLFFRGQYKLGAAIVGGLLLVGVAAITVLPILFPHLLSATHAMDQRLEIWITAVRGIRECPIFGRGPMTYELICSRLGGYITAHSHNLYLDLLLNFGIVGTVGILYFVFSQLARLLRRLRHYHSTSTNVLLVVSFCAVCLHGMTDVTILWSQTAMMFLVIYSSIGIKPDAESRRDYVKEEAQQLITMGISKS